MPSSVIDEILATCIGDQLQELVVASGMAISMDNHQIGLHAEPVGVVIAILHLSTLEFRRLDRLQPGGMGGHGIAVYFALDNDLLPPACLDAL